MKYSCLILISLMLYSCKGKTSEIHPSFYYWKTNFEFSKQDSILLAENQVEKLYVRFFDLDNGSYYWRELEPTGRLRQSQKFPSTLEIVPVVYIDNNALDNTQAEKMGEYAEKTYAKIIRMHHRQSQSPLRELQFDCDWNNATRDKYFYFLKEIRKLNPGLKLSSTIRLYQYKYPEKSGIPPVDKGVLMYYNMSDLRKSGTKNHILDHEEGSLYLNTTEEYPIPLDIAFPIYSQGVEYDQEGFFGLIRGEEMEKMINNGNLVPINTNEYKIENNFGNEHIPEYRIGNTIRYETVNPSTLKKAAAELAKKFPESQVIFFDLQATNYKNYSSHYFHEIQNLFIQ